MKPNIKATVNSLKVQKPVSKIEAVKMALKKAKER